MAFEYLIDCHTKELDQELQNRITSQSRQIAQTYGTTRGCGDLRERAMPVHSKHQHAVIFKALCWVLFCFRPDFSP